MSGNERSRRVSVCLCRLLSRDMKILQPEISAEHDCFNAFILFIDIRHVILCHLEVAKTLLRFLFFIRALEMDGEMFEHETNEATKFAFIGAFDRRISAYHHYFLNADDSVYYSTSLINFADCTSSLLGEMWRFDYSLAAFYNQVM